MKKNKRTEEKKVDTLLTYGDDIQTGFFSGIFGIILIIGTCVFLLINEGMGLNNTTEAEAIKTWSYRLLSLFLMFFGFKMSLSIIKSTISAFPHLKSSFTFINTQIIAFMALITSLFIISLFWIFAGFKVFCAIWIVIILSWKKMRSIKKHLKQRYEEEFRNSGEEKYEHFGKMTGQTYKEAEDTTKKVKNIANKVIGKFK